MLGRTANSVLWMARYVERAENMARLLASTYHMSLLHATNGDERREWQAPLALCTERADFEARHGEASAANVLAYMALDLDNPDSIHTSIRRARENARATRTELTTEVWEAINQTHFDFAGLTYGKMLDMGFEEFFDWVKERSHLFRGAVVGTMRRGDAFTFARLGTFIERADNTARFLATKWQLLSPGSRPLAAEEYFRWGALLRAFSAFKAYREVYSVIIEPRQVAELLVLRDDMPRSLFACVGEQHAILKRLRRTAASTRIAGQLCNRMEASRIDGILRSGLPRYLNDFVRRNNELSELIGREFMLTG